MLTNLIVNTQMPIFAARHFVIMNYPNGKHVKEFVNTGRVNHLCPGIYSTMKQGTNQRAKHSNVST